MISAQISRRLGRTTALDGVVRGLPGWLAAQTLRAHHDRHPLFRWLDGPDSEPVFDQVAETLDRAIAHAPRGRAHSRAQDLVRGDASSFWSAACELLMAAALGENGLDPEIGDPDLSMCEGESRLLIELTALHPTTDFMNLMYELGIRWTGPGRASIWCPDESASIIRRQIEDIVGAVIDAAVSFSMPAVLRTAGDEEIYGREVNLSSIIRPTDIRAFIEDAASIDASWVGGAQFMPDLWQDIDPLVQKKQRQIEAEVRPDDQAIIAVEIGRMDSAAPFLWMTKLQLAGSRPALRGRPWLVGVLAYVQGLLAAEPTLALFIPNLNRAEPPRPLAVKAAQALGFEIR